MHGRTNRNLYGEYADRSNPASGLPDNVCVLVQGPPRTFCRMGLFSIMALLINRIVVQRQAKA
jgi:hypothetical protein